MLDLLPVPFERLDLVSRAFQGRVRLLVDGAQVLGRVSRELLIERVVKLMTLQPINLRTMCVLLEVPASFVLH